MAYLPDRFGSAAILCPLSSDVKDAERGAGEAPFRPMPIAGHCAALPSSPPDCAS
jgi:hypothetical protein